MNTYQTPMTDNQLMDVAPSIFATRPWEGMSERYAFIPTIDVVTKMRAEGFQPFAATQAKSRIAGKGEFTKHLIRFRDMRMAESAELAHLGGLYPEIVLTNGHDGTSAYNLNAGIFRMVCINGLVAGDSYGKMKVMHRQGSLADGVIDATFEIVEEFPKLLAAAEDFGKLRLEAPQAQAYASAALSLRYEENAPVSVQQVLTPRRQADAEPTLWNVMNRVQEHLVGGGVRGRNPQTHRRLRTRPVTGIAENTKLNKAIWTLTETMAKLVA